MVSEDFPAEVGDEPAGFAAVSRLADYHLEERIGAGGMAVVFRARDERLQRRVALKVLAPALARDEAFRHRFIRESRAAAAVDDPHIIPVFEAGEAEGVLFLAMRYVPGGDVRTLVRRAGQLSPAQALAIISPVASALDAAHSAGLVHRDVKLANILLDVHPGRPDHVYLSDFGLSKMVMSSLGPTQTGQFLGTPGYSAPEQLEGKQVDGRADQYSLACATFELLCGQTPFPRDQLAAVIWAHLSEPPPTLTSERPDLPPAIDSVLAKALAKDPADRYASCWEFADALRAALGLPPYHSNAEGIVRADRPQDDAAWSPGTGAGEDSIPDAPVPATQLARPGPSAEGQPKGRVRRLVQAEAPRVTARMPSAARTRRARDRSPSPARPLPAARRPRSSPSPSRGPRSRPTRSGPSARIRDRPARSRFALRNWRVRWRLAALIAVPLLTAAVFGALTINRNITNWQTTGRVQHLAQLNSAVLKYIQAVEDERDYTVASTANGQGYSARLRTARRVTDGAAAEVAALADGTTAGSGYQPGAVQAVNAVQVGAETLPFVRKTVADPLFPVAAIIQVYTVNIIQPANTFTSVVGNETTNTNFRRDVTALGQLLQVEDSRSVQRAILLRAVSLPQPTLSPDDIAGLQQAQQQEKADLANFDASVDPAEQLNYSNTVTGAPVDQAAQQESLALALLPGASSAHPLTPANARVLAAANVNEDMSFTVGKVRQVADELNGNISMLAKTSRNNATTGLLITSLVTLLLLLLVLLIFTMVARSLTRPLRKLVSAGFSSLAAPNAGPPA
jgi:serine/threonine protein kinase